MKFLFIHIGKTGGKTVRKLLNSQKYDCNYDCIHNHALIRREAGVTSRIDKDYDLDLNNYKLVAYFVRHPYERLKSCYEYFVKGGLNQYAGDFIPGDESRQKRILKNFPDFETCCLNLSGFSSLVPHARPMTNSTFHPLDGVPVFQGRYENYEDDVLRLFEILKLPLERKAIVWTNSSEDKDRLVYTEEMKKSVYTFYKDDFEKFDYEK